MILLVRSNLIGNITNTASVKPDCDIMELTLNEK